MDGIKIDLHGGPYDGKVLQVERLWPRFYLPDVELEDILTVVEYFRTVDESPYGHRIYDSFTPAPTPPAPEVK